MDIQTGILSLQVVNAAVVSQELFYNMSTNICKTRSEKNEDS